MADISVIIPCYNVAPYIDRCLTTITLQAIQDEYDAVACQGEGLDSFYCTLLESLKLPLNKSPFQQLAKPAESYWNPTHNSHSTPSQE